MVVDLDRSALEAQAAHDEFVDAELHVAVDVEELEECNSVCELKPYEGENHSHLVPFHMAHEVSLSHNATGIRTHVLEDASQPLQHLLRLLKLPLHSQINVHVRALHGVIDEDRIDHVQDGQDRDDNKKNEDQGILH